MQSLCLWAWLALLVACGQAAVYDALFGFTRPLIPQLENAGSSDLFPTGTCFGFKLEEATIEEMQRAMEDGRVTSVQLVSCYMTRTFQTQEYIRSVLQINPDALAIAAERDAERANGTLRGPLHGIPFTVKDNIGTKDNMETTAGSLALLGSRVPRDAHTVKRLRTAGAVLFGKAAMSEWADMRSSDYSEGYSARGGQCRSAYNLTVNPGGSSSGSGVGVAANAIAFSLGTDTDGSVINPAMRNSIVGFKPTVGLTSRAGVIPESEHQDTVGTFGRTVRDAILPFDAIYGVDPEDKYTLAQQGKTPSCGYAQFLSNKTALKDAVFGIPWKSFWVYADAEQQRVLGEFVELIKSAGATIVNETEITGYDEIISPDGWNWDYGTTRGFPNKSEFTYIKVDFFNNINSYLSKLKNTKMRHLRDIIQYNNDNPGSEGGCPRCHPAFSSGQDNFDASLKTGGVQDKTYSEALKFCQTSTRTGIDDALNHMGKKLNGLLVPLNPGQSCQIAAQAGYPMITLPAGIHSDSGMGFGLGIMQTAWGEAELIRWGSAIEDLARTSPYRRTLPKWRGYLEKNIPVPF